MLRHAPLRFDHFADPVLALMYGIGYALTLDEFALWLNLGVMAYWGKQNRLSLDAIVLFGALLAIGTWGAQRWQREERRSKG